MSNLVKQSSESNTDSFLLTLKKLFSSGFFLLSGKEERKAWRS